MRTTPGRARRGLLLVALVILLGLVAVQPGAASPHSGAVYYVSLGDSMAAGFQPSLRPKSTFHHGYADQLLRIERSVIPRLQLVKLGCPGESSQTLVDGGVCAFPDGSQLAQAVDVLESHPGDIEFITLDIGGNDIFDACMDFDTGVLDADCVTATLPTIEANVATTVETLRSAAPGVPIYGMTYHDPLLSLWVIGPDPALAQADAAVWDAFDAGLEDAYRAEGVRVADVAGAFAIDDFTDFVPLHGVGLVPLNVANDCNWTWNCTPPPLGWDPHPNTEGYGVIARAFADVVNP